MHVSTTGEKGVTERWAVEWSGTTQLNNAGVTKESLKVGDLVVIDLRDGEEILNVSGDYEYTSDEGIVYWERGEDGTAETCDSFAELTAMGLGTRILNGMLLNLETKESTPTGDTTCEGVS